jgi:hypothetical protein
MGARQLPLRTPLRSTPTGQAGSARWLGTALGALLGLIAACSDKAAPPPPAQPTGDVREGPSSDPLIGRSCDEGQTESCALTLGEHDGMLSCYEGTRTCSAGAFGPCENGVSFTLSRDELNPNAMDPSAQGADLHPLVQGPATPAPRDCINNPCNSYCREFNVEPGAGVTADADTSATPLQIWPEGSLADYPAATVSLGIHEPCQVAGDCQFNTSCTDPAYGSCEHSICTAGSALVPGCNRCADTVCALKAECCGTQPVCLHDPCDSATGAPLERTCDPCVAAVCTAHPECCDTSWNDTCVGYVATDCAPLGQSCDCPPGSVEIGSQCVYAPPGERHDFNTAAFACNELGNSWNLLQVDDATENAAAQALINNAGVSGGWLGGFTPDGVDWQWRATTDLFFQNDAVGGSLQGSYTYENWGSGEPELGNPGRGLAMNPGGEWYDEALDSELLYVCEGPRSFLTPRKDTFSWSSTCVDLAVATCGVECPAGIPFGAGACVARLPTQLDPRCTSFDLALGAGCDDSGKPAIPVCNHGQKEAPAGLRLSFLPPSELGKALPDLSGAGDCALTEAIPPGRCVVVNDCPGLDKDLALVVNPRDGSENSDECRLDDNWSVYQPVSCGAPICESGTFDMRQVQNRDCTVTLRNPLGIDASEARVSIQGDILEPHCAADEELWGNSCYFFSRDPETWDNAETQCQRRGPGWSLVALNSPAENEHIRNSTNPSFDIQIGLNDKSVEGDHVWANGSCRKYDNWDPGAPNDPIPGSEQCARMTRASADRWDDTECDNFQTPYVCEGPVLDAQGACGVGETMGPNGRCYIIDTKPITHAEALDLCPKRGTGWQLAQVDSLKTNDFLTGLLDCTPAWMGGINPAIPAVTIPVGDLWIDPVGAWNAAAAPDEQHATVCEGPTSTGAPRPLALVKDAAACTGGDEFFFDGGPVAPETLRLCSNTCSTGAAESGARLDIAVPCAPPTTPVTATTVDGMYYSADCEGGSVIWDFFYYDTVTPADSRIEFEIRTAPTLAELTSGAIAFTPIAQAHAIPTDTQRCEVNPPGCPIDIFTKLGSPAQQYKELELRVKMVPGSSGEGPLLRDWRVRYSCPPSQ